MAEPEEKAPWWMEAIKTLGLPTVFLLAIVYMLWSAGRWAGSVIIYPLFEHQTKMIDNVDGMVNATIQSMKSIEQSLKANNEQCIETMKTVNESARVISSNGVKMDILIESIRMEREKLLGVLGEIEENTSKEAPK